MKSQKFQPTPDQVEAATEKAKEHFRKPPTYSEVRQWIEHDINTAIYALSMVARHPKLLDTMAKEMYEEAQKTPEQKMAEREKAASEIRTALDSIQSESHAS